jgi:Transglutaminase-like superfamily
VLRRALLFLLLPAALLAEEAGLSLYVIETRAIDRHGSDGEQPQYADLYFKDAQYAAGILAKTGALSLLAVDDDRLRVAVSERLTLGGEPQVRHRSPSFVIDFDEPSVAAVHRRLLDGDRRPADIAGITSFVHRFIDNKTYVRSFDFASTTARTAAGDCTEHAVLQAALARAESLPARVIFGLMLVDDGESAATYSHAWTEVHDGERWQITDATLPETQMPVRHLRYLPLLELENEGPGYSYGMMNYALLLPVRVELVYGTN